MDMTSLYDKSWNFGPSLRRLELRHLPSMGANFSSAAKGALENEISDLSQMMKVLQVFADELTGKVKSERGANAAGRDKKVVGGRSTMRVQQIRVTSSDDIASELKAAISDFFDAAQGGISGDQKGAQQSAIDGVQKTITGSINAVLGVSSGQALEKGGTFTGFLNNAFVNIIYKVHSYSISAEAWGKEKRKSGVAYVADIAVLGYNDITDSEQDAALADALGFDGPADEEDEILASLRESSLLSQQLQNPDLKLSDVASIATSFVEAKARARELLSKSS